MAIVARVIVPAAMPRLFTGLRIALAGSFIMLYVGEVLGGSGEGLGFRIVLTSQTGEYDLLYAAIACFAVLGVVGDRLLLMVGRRLTRGHELEVLGDAR
ncbi:MAG TPA: ABC transporter permease subunit [Nocardioides sp.]|uniref:ABC transporter permease n=1 Tax=Nocardioides sp. 31GB23 TaxID=3156065 RepID=UPI002FBBD095